MNEDPAKVTAALREKIMSKMEVAKFFAAFISLLIGILLKEGNLTSLYSKVGILFFVSSLGFCVVAMSAYDHLLWPREYWTDLHSDEDSEECFHKRLAAKMVNSWKWFFVPAVACFAIAIFLSLILPLGSGLNVNGHRILVVLLVLAVGTPIGICFAEWPPGRKPIDDRHKIR